MRISRRSLLAAATLPLAGCAGAGLARPQTMYVTPTGAGGGLSWDAAASLGDIERLVKAIQPGGEILIAAERGEYALAGAIDIGAGGGADTPARIRGVNSASGASMPALLRGTRSGAVMGVEAFRLGRGADHLHFSHFDFRNVGNGCFRVGAPLSGLSIEDCAFDNIYRFLENTAFDDGSQASIESFAVRRCSGARVERGFSRIRYGSRNGVLEDCRAQGLPNEGGFIPVGCALEDNANTIVYRRCIMENFQQWRAGPYWNGDGFSDEPDNHDIRYESCEARGSTDGGFDCKSPGVALQNCVAEDNKRNFRIWGDRAALNACTSRNPNFRGRGAEHSGPCHIWIGGEDGARVTATDLTIEDPAAAPIFEFDHDDASVEVRGITIHPQRRRWGDVEVSTQGEVTIITPS